MSKIDQLVKTIVKAIEERDKKKTRALDTVATVVRVDDDYAWVRLAGSDMETPVKQTISVKKGDTVQVRASKGKAWIVGNETAPPTDDTLAKKALQQADKAGNTARKASDMAIVADVMWYLASAQDEGVTVEDEGWTKEPQEMTESLPYLWAYHDYERGNGKHFKSEPVIIAMYAEDGKGIDTFTTYYALGTSTSTAPTTGWATSFTYLSGYYIWRKELITYDDGTTNWTTAVYDAGLTQSSSLSYDTAQYIWTETTGLTNVPTGQYVTEVNKASYRSNPTGRALLLRSAGLYLRYAAKTLVELVSAGLKIYEPNDSTYPSAQFLSSGAVIGKENESNIKIGSSVVSFCDGSDEQLRIISPSGGYGGSIRHKESDSFYANINLYADPTNTDATWDAMARTDYNGLSRIYAYRKKNTDTSFIRMEASNTAGETNLVHIDPTSMTVSGSFTAGNIDTGYESGSSVAGGTYNDITVTFHKTFPTTPNVVACFSSTSTAANFGHCTLSVHGTSTTGCTIRFFNGDTSSRAPNFTWIAMS